MNPGMLPGATVGLPAVPYIRAAEYFNAAAWRPWAIFTTDGHFRHYARHLPIRLHARRSSERPAQG